MATPYNDQWRLGRWCDAVGTSGRVSAARKRVSAGVRSKPLVVEQADRGDIAVRSYFLLRRWPRVSPGGSQPDIA
jgi:hypothetical protein